MSGLQCAHGTANLPDGATSGDSPLAGTWEDSRRDDQRSRPRSCRRPDPGERPRPRDEPEDQPARLPERNSGGRGGAGAPGSVRLAGRPLLGLYAARTERPLSSGAHRVARQPPGLLRGRPRAARPGGERRVLGRFRRRRRGQFRPGRGGRRHQRPQRGLVLPEGLPGSADPDSRQPRRFRRPREAERVHPRRPDRAWLRRYPVARLPLHLHPGGERPAGRSGSRPRPLLHRLRPRSLPVPRSATFRLLRQRGLRRGPPGDRHGTASRRRVRRRDAPERGRTRRLRAPLRGPRGSVARPGRNRQEGAAGHHQLRGFSGRSRDGRRDPGALPAAHSRALRHGAGRRSRARPLGSRLSRVPGHGSHRGRPSPAQPDGEAERQPGSLHLPLPGRKRHHRPAAGAQAGAGGRRGQHPGGHRRGAAGLRRPRPSRLPLPHPPEQHRGPGAGRRRRPGQRHLCPGRGRDPGSGRATSCSPATTG